MRYQSALIVPAVLLRLVLWPAAAAPQADDAKPLTATPSAEVPAQPPASVSLRLDDAIRRGVEQSALAAEAGARTQEAQAHYRGAGRLESPIASVAHWVGTGTGGTDEDILLTQSIELGGKRQARAAAALAEREAAAADSQGTRLELVFAIQSAYYNALRAEVDCELALEGVRMAEAFADAADVQFQAGDVARSQVVRSGIEVTTAQQELKAAEVERANRYAELASLIGLPDGTPLMLTDALESEPAPLPAGVDELVALGLRNRPDLQAAEHEQAALAASAREVERERRPDLFWEARHSPVDSIPGGNTLRVGVSFPLPWAGSHAPDLDAAHAAVAAQEARRKEATRVARLEIENACRALEQARQEVESFRSGRLAQSSELLEMARIGYDRGATSYLELLDAQHVYRTEQASYATALADYRIALADLQRAVGGQLP